MLADRIADLAEVELMADDTDIPSAGAHVGLMHDFTRRAESEFESIRKRLHDLATKMQSMEMESMKQAMVVSKEIEAGRSERIKQVGDLQTTMTGQMGMLTTAITSLEAKVDMRMSGMQNQMNTAQGKGETWASVGRAVVIAIPTVAAIIMAIVTFLRH